MWSTNIEKFRSSVGEIMHWTAGYRVSRVRGRLLSKSTRASYKSGMINAQQRFDEILVRGGMAYGSHRVVQCGKPLRAAKGIQYRRLVFGRTDIGRLSKSECSVCTRPLQRC